MDDPKGGAWPMAADQEDEVRSLLERARRGDETAMDELRAAMDRHPELWRSYGDLAAHARGLWAGLAAGGNLALRESLGRAAEAMRDDLAGPGPSPLVALLAERAAACWLQVGFSDAASAAGGDLTLRQAEFALKRQDSAHRRYLAAIEALAKAKRLLGSGAGAKVSTTATSAAVIAKDGEETPILGIVAAPDPRPGGKRRGRRRA